MAIYLQRLRLHGKRRAAMRDFTRAECY